MNRRKARIAAIAVAIIVVAGGLAVGTLNIVRYVLAEKGYISYVDRQAAGSCRLTLSPSEYDNPNDLPVHDIIVRDKNFHGTKLCDIADGKLPLYELYGDKLTISFPRIEDVSHLQLTQDGCVVTLMSTGVKTTKKTVSGALTCQSYAVGTQIETDEFTVLEVKVAV